jgi:hypothetical protein
MATKQDLELELGRLAALAGRFAAEGQMNLSKLVEAALYAYTRRAGRSYRPSVTVGTMDSELAAGMDFLKQHEATGSLLPVLETGRRALAEHRDRDLLAEEAPDAFVCRVCGHTALRVAPQRCPDCGAWPPMFRRFVAISGWDNTDPVNPASILGLLAESADILGGMLNGLDEESARAIPAGSDWSVRDHVNHLSYVQDLLDARVDLMLKHDNPPLAAAPTSEPLTNEGGRPAGFGDLLRAFLEKRRRSLDRLEKLPLRDLWRTGRHPEFGEITVLRQAAYAAHHEQTHLQDIEALLNLGG